MKMLKATGLLLAILFVAPTSLQAYVEAPDDPPLETLIAAQPVIVFATAGELVKTTKKTFPAVEGGVDPLAGYTETYEHYRFDVVERIKGEVPDSFEVRVIAGKKAGWQPGFGKGGRFVMVLAPDAGSRAGFLVVHRAAYPLSEDSFEAPSTTGTRSWAVDELREYALAEAKRGKLRAEASPEPPEVAKVPVVAGEDTPREEKPPAEAAKTRDRGPQSETELGDAVPQKSDAPGEKEADKPFRISTVLIIVAIGVIALLLWIILRRGK